MQVGISAEISRISPVSWAYVTILSYDGTDPQAMRPIFPRG